jgi:hypothetical protein
MKTLFSVAANSAVRSVRPLTSEYTRCASCGRERLTTDPLCVCQDPAAGRLQGRKGSGVYGVGAVPRVPAVPFEARVSRVGWGPLVAPDPETEPTDHSDDGGAAGVLRAMDAETTARTPRPVRIQRVGFCEGLGWVCAALLLAIILVLVAVNAMVSPVKGANL